MSRFERWILRTIFARQVCQGFDHNDRIAELYGLIREACDNEFTEDNSPTRDVHLRECFNTTQSIWDPERKAA